MTPFDVVCVNDSNRPDGIPTSKWVKKGEIYTVIVVGRLMLQNGCMGFKLKQINIDDCFPYQFFSAERFRMLTVNPLWAEDVLSKIIEEVKTESV
jgi:hypothetical protein